MNRVGVLLPLVLGLLVQACADNTAPGNDREAERSPPAPAAEVMSAGLAIQGVSTDLLMPQTMTDADLGNIPEMEDGCVFRMTRVGLPVLAYGSTGVLKLNGKLVPLPAQGAGRYAADGVGVTVRPLGEEAEEGGPFAAELVLRLPDAPDELGFHGFAECDAGTVARG